MTIPVFNTSSRRWKPWQAGSLLPFLLLGLVLLAGCAATREGKVQGALVKAGMPEGYARCLAQEATPRLSNTQLRRLRDAALALEQNRVQHTGTSLSLLRQQLDPETVAVVASSVFTCTREQWGLGQP